MAPQDLDKLIKKYLQGDCTEEEKISVDAFYSSLGKDTSKKLDQFQAAKIEDRILKNLQRHMKSTTDDTAGETVKFIPAFWKYTGIAASVLLLIGIGYFLLSDTVIPQSQGVEKVASVKTVSAENKELTPKRVILPDGSMVTLSANSKLVFKQDDVHARELFLEGEAYFDVAHDAQRPFYVYSGNVVAKVLGTSFNINAFDANSKVTVTVKTGKVSVYSKNAEHRKVVLTPHQEAIYDRKTDLVATHGIEMFKAGGLTQKLEEIRFDETPVSEVLNALGREYNVEIKFNKEILSGCMLTSTFYEEGFYDRIDIICTAIGATYNIVDGQVIIVSNGCKGTKQLIDE